VHLTYRVMHIQPKRVSSLVAHLALSPLPQENRGELKKTTDTPVLYVICTWMRRSWLDVGYVRVPLVAYLSLFRPLFV
jgi:hypothetical protein